MIVRFRGQTPTPKAIKVGVELDNSVTAVQFELPSISPSQTETLYWTDGQGHADADALVDGLWTIHNTMTQYSGEKVCYIAISDGGSTLWHSEPFAVEVVGLPDTEGTIDQTYPSAIQAAVNEVEMYRTCQAMAGQEGCDMVYDKAEMIVGSGRIKADDGTIVDVSSGHFEYISIPVNEGDTLKFTTNGTNGGAGRGYAIYDGDGQYITGASTPGVLTYTLTMPTGAAAFKIGSDIDSWDATSRKYYLTFANSGYKVYIDANAYIKRGQYSSDLNLINKSGTYYLGSGCSNGPAQMDTTNMTLLVFSGAARYGDYVWQYLLTNEGRIFRRMVHGNMHTATLDWKELDGNELAGKTWNAVGDSITKEALYMEVVKNALGISYTNCGKASSTLAINNTFLQNSSIVELVCGLNGNTAYTDADVWTVNGGLNDVPYRSGLGALAATGTVFDNETVYGALQSIVENIQSRRARPRLILITPTHTTRDTLTKAEFGITIGEIRQAMIDVGEYYGVPVLDMWAVGGINGYNAQRQTNPTTRDGVHPNSDGAALMAIPVARAIRDAFYGG